VEFVSMSNKDVSTEAELSMVLVAVTKQRLVKKQQADISCVL
jgi:hypothetical protein